MVRSLEVEAPIPLDVLEIKSVDLNLVGNRETHYTTEYEYPGLVVRRGQDFTINLTTTKPLPTGKLSSIVHSHYSMVHSSVW